MNYTINDLEVDDTIEFELNAEDLNYSYPFTRKIKTINYETNTITFYDKIIIKEWNKRSGHKYSVCLTAKSYSIKITWIGRDHD